MSTQTYKPKLYFAHPIPTYGTEQETRAVRYLQIDFPNYEIINPEKAPGRNMQFYLGQVAESDRVVFMAFPNDLIGRGTYREVTFAQELGKPVHYLDQNLTLHKLNWRLEVVDQFNWKQYAKVWVL